MGIRVGKKADDDTQPYIGCSLTDSGLVLVQIYDGDETVAIALPAAEARESFSRMFNVAAAAPDYAK